MPCLGYFVLHPWHVLASSVSWPFRLPPVETLDDMLGSAAQDCLLLSCSRDELRSSCRGDPAALFSPAPPLVPMVWGAEAVPIGINLGIASGERGWFAPGRGAMPAAVTVAGDTGAIVVPHVALDKEVGDIGAPPRANLPTPVRAPCRGAMLAADTLAGDTGAPPMTDLPVPVRNPIPFEPNTPVLRPPVPAAAAPSRLGPQSVGDCHCIESLPPLPSSRWTEERLAEKDGPPDSASHAGRRRSRRTLNSTRSTPP